MCSATFFTLNNNIKNALKYVFFSTKHQLEIFGSGLNPKLDQKWIHGPSSNIVSKVDYFLARETRRNVLERLLSVSTAQNPEIFLRLTKCDAIINIDRFFSS